MENNKKSISSIIVVVIVLALLIGVIIWYFMRPKDVMANSTNLDSLVIANYPITFDKGTTTYTINVGEDVDSLEVTAVPEDKSAKVVITGNTNIETGTNEIKITVTADDGTSKIYTVHVNKTANSNDIIDDNMNDNNNDLDNGTVNNNDSLDKDTNDNNNTNNTTKSIIYE